MCLFKGLNGACGKRIQYSARHAYFGRDGACSLAVAQVHSECPACEVCHLEESQCAEALRDNPGTAPPFLVKKASDPIITTAHVVEFDCAEGMETCQQTWTMEKKAWCYKHAGRSCGGHQFMAG